MEKQLEQYFDVLWPICRSITGNGLRKSFEILQEIIPFDLTEVPTATSVLDWKNSRPEHLWKCRRHDSLFQAKAATSMRRLVRLRRISKQFFCYQYLCFALDSVM